MVWTLDSSELARLDAEARLHKSLERQHRRAAERARKEKDALLEFARRHNIPIEAQPIEEAQPDREDDDERTDIAGHRA
jgi:hypothetical protein